MKTLIVFDTNILVSALWRRPSNAAHIIDLVAANYLQPCHNAQILTEYKSVLLRPRLKFSANDVNNLLDLIIKEGISILSPISTIPFVDESDRKFYDVARSCGAILITGNTKHYPKEPFILKPAEFLEL